MFRSFDEHERDPVKVVRFGLFSLATMVAVFVMSSAWGETTTGGTGQTPPPPQLVANLLDPLGHAAGNAGYGAQKNSAGAITASFLNVYIGPLPASLAGKTVIVVVDGVPAAPPVKVAAGTATTPPGAQLNLNSANKVKVPVVKAGSVIQIIVAAGDPPIAQGKFQTPPPPTK
jgi:hypothetical protein